MIQPSSSFPSPPSPSFPSPPSPSFPSPPSSSSSSSSSSPSSSSSSSSSSIPTYVSLKYVPWRTQMVVVLIVVLWWCVVIAVSHAVHVGIEYSLLFTIIGLLLAMLQETTYLNIDGEKREVTIIRHRPPPYFMNRAETIPFRQIDSVKVVWTGKEQLEENRRNKVTAVGHSEKSLVQASTILELKYKPDGEEKKTIQILSFEDFLGWEKNYTPVLHEWCKALRGSVGEYQSEMKRKRREKREKEEVIRID